MKILLAEAGGSRPRLLASWAGLSNGTSSLSYNKAKAVVCVQLRINLKTM